MKPYSKEDVLSMIVWFQNEFVTTHDQKKRSYQLWALKKMMTDIMESSDEPLDVMLTTRNKFLDAACIDATGKYAFAVAADICDAAIDLFT